MFKKKVFMLLLVTIIVLFGFSGCAKCIDTEYGKVEVTIVNEYYHETWLQPVRVGTSTTFITHSAKYQITVEYNGVEYTIDDSDTYEKYKDKVGQKANGTLKISKFDDGSVKYNITALE